MHGIFLVYYEGLVPKLSKISSSYVEVEIPAGFWFNHRYIAVGEKGEDDKWISYPHMVYTGMKLVSQIRSTTEIPLVCLSYWVNMVSLLMFFFGPAPPTEM